MGSVLRSQQQNKLKKLYQFYRLLLEKTKEEKLANTLWLELLSDVQLNFLEIIQFLIL